MMSFILCAADSLIEFTLVGSIQTARPISVSKDMTLRPDRTQDLSGHMIAVGCF